MESTAPKHIGRYVLHDRIATGGMATVHIGRLLGQEGFRRTVAIKVLHPHIACDPEMTRTLLTEARLVARIRHPNVVPILDVVEEKGVCWVVMEYVDGETLLQLLKTARAEGQPPSPAVAASIVCSTLRGLHAAHDAVSESGEPLGIVHRDISPQNILVGTDGVARVIDFGIAKATSATAVTQHGYVKGKLAYMPLEQIEGRRVTRRADVFASAVVLWESLTATRLVQSETARRIADQLRHRTIPAPSTLAAGVPPELDAVVLKGLSRDPEDRFATAGEMADQIEDAISIASTRQTADWVRSLAGGPLDERARVVARMERGGPREVTTPNVSTTRRPAPRRSTPRLTTTRVVWSGLAAIVISAAAASVWAIATQTASHVPTPVVASSGPSAPPALGPNLTPIASVAPIATASSAPTMNVTSQASSVEPQVIAVPPTRAATRHPRAPTPVPPPSGLPSTQANAPSPSVPLYGRE